jgi:Domain of unknown function (DUF4214)
LGFDFWLGVLDNPLSLAEIATDFSIQPEATALYPYLADPTNETPEAFLTKVYQNLFDRDLDAEGRDFWSEVILSGRPLGDILQEIIRGAAPADQAVLDSKAALAEYWVEAARADGGYSPMRKTPKPPARHWKRPTPILTARKAPRNWPISIFRTPRASR